MICRLSVFFLFVAIFFAPDNASAQFCRGKSGFVENRGQLCDQSGLLNDQVIAISSKGDLDVLLNKLGFSYQVKSPSGNSLSPISKEEVCSEMRFHRVDIMFENMSERVWHEWRGEQAEYENFIIGTDHGLEEIYGVRSFSSVVYHNLYEGIDLEFLIDEMSGNVKYNFLLKSVADLDKINMRYEGQFPWENPSSSITKELLLQTSLGSIKESLPASYFMVDGKKIPLDIGYRVFPDGHVKFEFMNEPVACDNCPLIIDPTPNISWSTYFGGSGADQGTAVELDGMGNVFMGGNTASSAGIATAGAHQGVYGGAPFNDAFISKFDYNGLRLWSTYFGGTNDDQLFDLACDAGGNVYLCGATSSTGAISTAGAYQVANGGNADAFIAKLNAAGVLQWSTFFGGTQSDGARALFISGPKLMVAGLTTSLNAISTAGAHQPAFAGGGSDGFVAEFSTAGVLNWSTYYGGTLAETFYGVAVNTVGNIYVAGSTNSTSGISTVGSHQVAAAGNNDGMLVCFDATGTRQWATYFGGALADNLLSLSIDATDNLLISGQTYSSAAIASAGAYDTGLSGSSDGFIAIFDANGVRQWSTYVGGNIVDQCYFSCFDAAGNIYAGGNTSSTSGLTTASSAQSVYGGGSSDAFIAQFNAAGNAQWITYLGGTGDDYGRSGVVDVINGVFMAGFTTSSNAISTVGSFQATLSSTSITDAFLIRYGSNFLLPIELIHFIATPYFSDVQCEWSVQDDGACYTYVIDKSADGVQWQSVTNVECDSSPHGEHYVITDPSPLMGVSYYRLKLQDASGVEHDSKIASVYFGDGNESVVYPVPASETLTARIVLDKDVNATLRITNLLGQNVFEESINGREGVNIFQFALNDLAPGCYDLRIIEPDGTIQNLKFIRSAQ